MCACEQAIFLDELTNAVHEIINDKALGLDGFPCEFYKATSDFVKPKLLQVHKKVIRK